MLKKRLIIYTGLGLILLLIASIGPASGIQLPIPTFSFVAPPFQAGGIGLFPDDPDEPSLIQAPVIPGSGGNSGLSPAFTLKKPDLPITVALAATLKQTLMMPVKVTTAPPVILPTQVVQGGVTLPGIVLINTVKQQQTPVKGCVGSITYINNSYYFVDYPCDWSVAEGENNAISQVTFVNPTNDAQVITALIKGQFNSTIDEFVKSRMAQLQAESENWKLITKGSAKLGGKQAYKITYSYTYNGVPMVGVNILTKNNDMYYGFVASTTKSSYAKNVKIIEKVASSFKFR